MKPFIFAILKFFTLILSLWLLFLSCLPCGDQDECVDVVTIATVDNHQQHNHSDEHCTPFCTCSCCAAHVVNQAVAFYEVPQLNAQIVQHDIYSTPFYPAHAHTIWQPPKLS